MHVELICEGRCNGVAREVIDLRVLAWRRTYPNGPKVTPLNDRELVRRLRGLTHTTHRVTNAIEAVCLACETPRRWGAV